MTAPKASLAVGAVPIQMPTMVAMLGLPMPESAPAPRIDMKMAAVLTPMVGQSWVPPKPPALMGKMASLSSLAALLPLTDIAALMQELQEMVSSLAENVQPVLSAAAYMPKKPMFNMVMAARMTLSMRAQGLCPMDLSGLDSTFAQAEGLPPAPGKFNATMGAVRGMGPIPKFALPIPMQTMAMTLASLGPLETIPTSLAMPPVSSTSFAGAAMALLAKLATLPPLPIDASKLLSELATLTDLAAIQAAFGEGAMTTAGVGKVQAMLNYMARLPLPPIPPLALGLQPKLDMLPPLPAVEAGARVASLNVQTFNQTMSLSPPRVPILTPLMALNALKNVLADILGVEPHSGCPVCMG
ncbi:hypothetical protein [uncultured Tateyamaria sp.]|uniref:hypothetical protein n=1 Tax=uncultured Tateyamaria sp. TaxID=455651 RepID=UPI00260CEB04|nr:hypothetical protein [uncultured Tateyamaria sp.]